MTVCFLGLFVNGRYHTACRYSGPMVWNSASVTFLKICYYGRQWDLIWCNDTCNMYLFTQMTYFLYKMVLENCQHIHEDIILLRDHTFHTDNNHIAPYTLSRKFHWDTLLKTTSLAAMFILSHPFSQNKKIQRLF